MTEERANPKYIALLAGVATLILVVGVFLKPKDKPPAPPVTQTEMVRLRRMAQRSTLENMSGFFSEMAAEISPRVVRLEGLGSSGVVWKSGGAILTAVPGPRFPDSVNLIAPTGIRLLARTVVASPDLPIALLEAPPNSTFPPVSPRPSVELKLGEWIVAVSRQTNRSYIFTPGWYGGLVPSSCEGFSYRQVLTNLTFTAAIRGGSLFDMNGELLAVIIQCGESYAAMAVEDVEAALEEGRSFPSRLLRRFGLRMVPLDDDLRAYFRADQGLLVKEVWKGYAGEAIGFIPGDVLVAVDGNTVSVPNDLEPLLQPTTQESFELQVLRSRRTLRLKLPLQEDPSLLMRGASVAGIGLGSAGYRVESIEPGSRAALAGLQPGDRLLRIGNTTVTSPQPVQRLLSPQNGRPTFVVVDRGKMLRGMLFQ